MLSEATARYLSGLAYRDNATRAINIVPWGGIYWDDEMPSFSYVSDIPEDDRKQIFQMFNIREHIWEGDTLPEADQILWDTIYSQTPGWAFFRRLTISEDDQCARELSRQLQAELDEEEDELEREMLRNGAHHIITTDEHGNETICTTFDLTEELPAGGKIEKWDLWLFPQKPKADC